MYWYLIFSKKYCVNLELADIDKLFGKRLAQLKGVMEGMIHNMHLNNWWLAFKEHLQEHAQGRFVLLIFNVYIGRFLKQFTSASFVDKGIIIARVANIMRIEIIDTKTSLTGTLNDSFLHDSVPRILIIPSITSTNQWKRLLHYLERSTS